MDFDIRNHRESARHFMLGPSGCAWLQARVDSKSLGFPCLPSCCDSSPIDRHNHSIQNGTETCGSNMNGVGCSSQQCSTFLGVSMAEICCVYATSGVLAGPSL